MFKIRDTLLILRRCKHKKADHWVSFILWLVNFYLEKYLNRNFEEFLARDGSKNHSVLWGLGYLVLWGKILKATSLSVPMRKNTEDFWAIRLTQKNSGEHYAAWSSEKKIWRKLCYPVLLKNILVKPLDYPIVREKIENR